MSDFRFDFEELPLKTDGGWRIAPVNGHAVVSYHDDGEWVVSDIYLEAYRFVGGKVELSAYRLCHDDDRFMYLAILGELESRWEDIQYDVDERLERDGIRVRNPNDEHRLTHRELL